MNSRCVSDMPHVLVESILDWGLSVDVIETSRSIPTVHLHLHEVLILSCESVLVILAEISICSAILVEIVHRFLIPHNGSFLKHSLSFGDICVLKVALLFLPDLKVEHFSELVARLCVIHLKLSDNIAQPLPHVPNLRAELVGLLSEVHLAPLLKPPRELGLFRLGPILLLVDDNLVHNL
jgi:hypothetical protein